MILLCLGTSDWPAMALGSLLWPVLLSVHPKTIKFVAVRQVIVSEAAKQRSPNNLEPKKLGRRR
ncbi:hypothetical protein BDV26DRAFT_194408 [Aspergillus bertholletiae]|uniref:Uncharacterized protein n=1 Tax=Aspergillus bertholletiae TaxID=1226010 RepID=A0A5N7BM90_9EURO|nr:hypothetical protein BDV26DRAFT_194408 [Aspergillus bertholletiae]